MTPAARRPRRRHRSSVGDPGLRQSLGVAGEPDPIEQGTEGVPRSGAASTPGRGIASRDGTGPDFTSVESPTSRQHHRPCI